MYFYYLTGLTVLMMVIAYVSQHSPMRKPGILGQPVPNPIGFLIPVVLFTLFSGLRSDNGDTYYYIYAYQLLGDNPPKPDAIFGAGKGYEWLQYFLRSQTDEPLKLLMITSAVSLVPVIYSLYKYSYPYELSIFLFVSTTYFALSMNGIRQYMAAGILSLAVPLMLSEKTWKSFIPFLLLTLAAYQFHASAMIMIPIYFLVRRKPWSFSSMAIILGSVAAVVIFDSILPSFLDFLENTDYSNYSENGWFTNNEEQGANIIRVFVMAVPVVLSYIARDKVEMMLGKKGAILTNLCILNLAIYILSVYNWIFARLAVYLTIYFIIMLAWLVSEGLERKQRSTVYGLCIAGFSYYYWVAKYTIDVYRSQYF